MVSKAQKFRLGIFISVTSLLLLGFFLLVAGNKLMKQWDIYHIKYHDISINGLQVGGSVKYHGISIGRVDDIIIDENDIRNVIVTISIKSGTPVKEDVKAVLIPVGITGLMQIELQGGTNKKSLLKSGDYITAGSSTFQNITGKAEVITEKLEILLNNLNKLTNEESQVKYTNIVSNVDRMISENKNKINDITNETDSLIVAAKIVVRNLNHTVNRINEVANSKELKTIIKNTAKISEDASKIDITQFSTDVKNTISQANRMIVHLDRAIVSNRQDIKDIVESLRETADYLNDFSRQISENPSILLKNKKQ